MRTPIELFNDWFAQEKSLTKVRLPAACCLSTVGTDGFPNARFVSLKAVEDNGFVITGNLSSRKGMEIDSDTKVALTFWWPETERQVRIQGTASKITEQLADQYFAERNRDSQIVSIVSRQGQEIDDLRTLVHQYEQTNAQFSNKPLNRPADWGGYLIEPVRIEFLEFKPTRFHHRTLYEWIDEQWQTKQIQP